MKILSTDYPTRGGTAVRDYDHVEGLGRVRLLALGADEEAMSDQHRVYNLGNGPASP